MTTIEKLLVQIFERKNWIEQQVKQQTELYNQKLATELLIDGINPPSWLLSPNNASDPIELNKDELISRMLHRYPQPSAHCSSAKYHFHDYPVLTKEDGAFSDGFFRETLASNKDLNRQYDPKVPFIDGEDHAGCTLNAASEPDVSITSPEDKTDERILNTCNAPDQSLAIMQRSKSRQKALELRSSGKARAKTDLSHENISDVFSSRIRLSTFATEQAPQKDQLSELAKGCVIGENCKDQDLGESYYQSKAKGIGTYTSRVTRSRSYAKVPDFTGDSLELGCSADACREDACSDGAKAMKRSASILDSEQADYVNKLQKSSGPHTCFQSCGDRKIFGSGKDIENNFYTGRLSQSKYSSKCARQSPKADSSSDNAQKIDNSVAELADNLPADHEDGSPTKVNPLDVLNEGCGDRQSFSEDHMSQKGMDTTYATRSSSSSQYNACIAESPDQELPFHTAKADGVGVHQSHGRLAVLSKAADEVGSVDPSFATVHRVRSRTRANDPKISNSVHSHGIPPFVEEVATSENGELQNASAGQIIPCHETNSMPDERGDADFVMGSELDSQNIVQQFLSSSSNDAKQRRELESLVALPPSNSVVLVEPKELDFNILDVYNLKTATSTSGKKIIDSFSEKMVCSSSDAAVAIDKEISGGGINHVSTSEASPEKLDELSKREEVPMDSYVFDDQNNFDTWTEKYVSIVSEHNMSNSSRDNSEAGGHCQNSEAQEEGDIMISKLVDTVDSQSHLVKLHLEEGHDSLLKQQNEEGDWSGDGKDKSLLMPNVSTGKTCRTSYVADLVDQSGRSRDSLMENVEIEISTCIVHDKIKLIPAEKSHEPCLECSISSQCVGLPMRKKSLETISTDGSPQVEDMLLERRLRPSSIESWPRLKRRKIEHQQTNSCTSSPSVGMRKLHTIQSGPPASTYLKNIEMDVDAALKNAFEVTKSTTTEIHEEMDSDLTGLETTLESQNGEVPFCFKEHNEQKTSSTIFSDKQLGVALDSSPTNKKARNSQGDFVEGMRSLSSSSNQFDAIDVDDRHCSPHSGSLDTNVEDISFENCTLTTRMLQGTKSFQLEDGLPSQCAVLSPSNNNLESIAADQAMPVFEGFIVEAQADSGEMDFAADGIDFEKLNHSRTTIERASILAKICRSNTRETPLSNFSSALQFRGTQNLFQSVPNGRLEGFEFSSTLPLKSDNCKQLGSGNSLVKDAKDAFERMPYSECLPYSSGWYRRNLGKQPASPVGNFWERLSSHTGSSEKCSGSNPELTCFTIEEDPCVSEENKDEIADNVVEEIDSVFANHSDKRQPLKDLTNLGLIPLASVSVEGDILRMGRVDFVSPTQDKVQQCINDQYRNQGEIREEQASPQGKTEVKKNQTLSIGANGTNKAKESINNSVMRSNLPNKSILKRQERKLSLKESRRNNIVSNVNSFVPLVQQRQAVSICAGKRDVKVKSLEAAEAAKRLAEKKENERKVRKEAFKHERAKLEEKNMRQIEVEKKKKEEERKKKDAEIMAKKRSREEEERKEKEKKRMRIEARQRQRDHEDKNRAEKAEKEKQRSKEEQMNSKKEYNKPQKQQNRDIVRGDAAAALKKIETKSTHSGLAMNPEKCGASGNSLGAGETMHTLDKSPTKEDLIVQTTRGSSYEISPYQCSDDEDEEDDELPTKKHIPSWASKSSMALLLPSSHEIDPDAIFPRESFCSMYEVIVPRKPQQKQVVA